MSPDFRFRPWLAAASRRAWAHATSAFRPATRPLAPRRALPAAAALALLAGCKDRPAPIASVRDGQWIWQQGDAALLADARETHPELTAGIWVATVGYDSSSQRVDLRLNLPPTLAPTTAFTAVVRFDPAFDAAWTRTDAELGALLLPQFDSLYALLNAQPAHLQEVQLDYDAPVRLLPRWAVLADSLAHRPGGPREVWVTSLVSHLRDPAYGRLFKGAVSGHILQVFDTGERDDSTALAEVRRIALQAGVPFRLGVGAYEGLRPDGRETKHRFWFSGIPQLKREPLWRGYWVYPGGEPWLHLLGGS